MVKKQLKAIFPSSLNQNIKNAGRVLRSCIFFLTHQLMRPSELAVGGQAVIEGVMMRGQKGFAIAVRRPNGEISIKREEKVPWHRKYKFLGVPVIRGVSVLFEAMVLGFQALEYSANAAMEEIKPEQSEDEKLPVISTTAMLGMFVISMAFAIGLFIILPNVATQYMNLNEASKPITFHLVAGVIRMAIFFIYVLVISRMNDIKRVFEYHGAEHKTIHAYEQDLELNVENTKIQSRFHPRCGTSFVLTVMVVSIFVFAIATGLIVEFWPGFRAYPVWFQKIILIPAHIIAMLPVAGLSYEFNRRCSKKMDSIITKMVVTPGLLFQRLTTREPDASQLEVGITALNKTIELGEV
jgi:uncharacterized protein YqhQ